MRRSLADQTRTFSRAMLLISWSLGEDGRGTGSLEPNGWMTCRKGLALQRTERGRTWFGRQTKLAGQSLCLRSYLLFTIAACLGWRHTACAEISFDELTVVLELMFRVLCFNTSLTQVSVSLRIWSPSTKSPRWDVEKTPTVGAERIGDPYFAK